MADGVWNDPPDVHAPSYLDKNETLTLRASADLTGERNRNFLKTPLFMYWAHVVGMLPPINAIGLLAESEPTPTLLTLRCMRVLSRHRAASSSRG